MKLTEVRRYTPSPADEIFALIRLSQAFYQEIDYRQAHKQHCQWYAETAARNRAELCTLKQRFRLLRWFLR
jgi:hypothetical protein